MNLIMLSRKPNCSYNCLIGMALKSSETGRLPVGEIYRFFEREFPYFLTATEPWKNSLRHSLSLGHFFRKYNSDRLQTKKGHLWEVEPHKAHELDKEMYMFLAKGTPDNLPSASKLSLLRQQMTKLFLDSIKNTPANSLANPQLMSPQRLSYYHQNHDILEENASTPKNTMSGAIVPPSNTISTSESGSNRSRPGCFSSPSTAANNLGPAEQQQVMVAASPTLQNRLGVFSMPPLYQHTTTKMTAANLLANQNEATRMHVNKEPTQQNGGITCVSEEAMQLIQFCSHCNFGLSPTSGTSGSRRDAPQRSSAGLQKGPNTTSNEECHTLETNSNDKFIPTSGNQVMFQDFEEEDNEYYPFISRPIGDHNLALSQINGGSYHVEPGAPRELTIKKYVQPKHGHPSWYKEFDDAIRPVVYDWNAWWENEFICCTLNDDAVINCIECRCEEKETHDKMPKRPTKNKLSVSSKKKMNAAFLTPIKDAHSISTSPTTIRNKSSDKWKTPCKTPSSKKGKIDSTKRIPIQQNAAAPNVVATTSSTHSIVTSDKIATATCKKVVSVCMSLTLMVSIPFRKLITERQMKKYCSEGGKHRITL